MNHKVLIPTDFSKNAFNAIDYALSLFKDEDCEFLIINSYYHSGMDKDHLLIPKPSEEEQKRIKEVSAKNIQELQMRVGALNVSSRHKIAYQSIFGPFYQVMENLVKEEKITLIIMGTQGKSNKKSVILGSNAVNIMEKIRSCPVMAIPALSQFKKPNEIVFPTSFRSQYKEHELDVLVDVARLTGAPIRILHIQNEEYLSEKQEENRQYLESILIPATFTHHRLYNMKVNDGVRTFVQSRESEMIAFVNKKHNFFGSIFSNPMVKELGMHTEVPLLAMHDKRG